MRQSADMGATPLARSEAIQPSFWDRLVNDLPGLEAEIESQQRHLTKTVGGAEKLDALLDGGTRAVEATADLSEDTKRQLFQLTSKLQRRSALRRATRGERFDLLWIQSNISGI